MKTTNNFETVQTHATVTTKKTAVDKFEAFLNKCDCFVQKAKPVVSNFFINKVPHACEKLEKSLVLLVGECVNLIRGCINLAVKLSVIAIALMMLYGFAQANPEVWAQIVSTGDAIVDGAHDVAMNFIEDLKAPFVFMKNIFDNYIGLFK